MAKSQEVFLYFVEHVIWIFKNLYSSKCVFENACVQPLIPEVLTFGDTAFVGREFSGWDWNFFKTHEGTLTSLFLLLAIGKHSNCFSMQVLKKEEPWAGDTAHQLRTFAALGENLCLILSSHIMWLTAVYNRRHLTSGDSVHKQVTTHQTGTHTFT